MKKQTQDLFPLTYKISLKPDLKKFIFEGEEVITLQINKPTKKVALNLVDLTIRSAEISGRKVSVKIEAEKETATFSSKAVIPKGRAELKIVFWGKLNENLSGFYKSRYEVGGEDRFMATTQFEAVDARRAFPCFDDPSLKAVFEVEFIIPKEQVAISNTIPIEEEDFGELKRVKFMPTPKMSTYLLAFIVGEFEWIEGATEEGVNIRVLTTPGKKEQARFALDVAKRSLSFYNKYFDIPYPLPNLDLIAIPDFESAAMENWGAITYRESAILIDERNSSFRSKQWVAIVIIHELAHQWFGNLVTMKWWDDLWLNEGFARYMEFFVIDHLFPEWNIWNEFTSRAAGSAMRLDSLRNTHPIKVEIKEPREINEVFDNISYDKGASVIRMLAEYLGEKDFKEGLRHYLKKHKYGNARTEDLWKALEHVSGKPIRKMMDAWISKPGYPVLSISRDKDLKIEQKRFLLSEKSTPDKWLVPLGIINEGKTKRLNFLSLKKAKLPTMKGWIKLNPNETAFYRTNYSKELLNLLVQPIRSKKLEPADRLGIVRDLFALAEAGEVGANQVLRFLDNYSEETELPIWQEVASGMGKIYFLLDEEHKREFQEFGRRIFSKIAERVGWEKKSGEKEKDALLRELAIYNFGKYGDERTIERAKDLFATGEIDPDIKSAVYGLVALNGGRKEFEKMLDIYKKAALQEEKDRVASSLGLFQDANLLKEALIFSVSPNVRSQDIPWVIGPIFQNSGGEELAWNFVKKNWNKFAGIFGEGGHLFGRLVETAGLLSYPDQEKDARTFLQRHKKPFLRRTIEQTLERIHANVLWRKRLRKEIGGIVHFPSSSSSL